MPFWAGFDIKTQVPELKSACKDVGTTCSGTKAELVVRLMNHFGLPDGRRCPVSAKLWVALRQEHAQYGHHNGVLTPLVRAVRSAVGQWGNGGCRSAGQGGAAWPC
mgnify:CR=1 FL=1